MSQMKKDCGYAAADLVKDGQVLGLGTGSTTLYFIEKVGMRVRDEGIEVIGIPTSFQSRLLARQWNIPLTDLSEHEIDLAVDGADEIDPDFNLIKGGGAAHTLEKIVDYSADELVEIISNRAAKLDYNFEPEALEFIKNKFNQVLSFPPENFGNARSVRNYLNNAINNQANRLVSETNLQEDELMTIKVEDLENLVLSQLIMWLCYSTTERLDML